MLGFGEKESAQGSSVDPATIGSWKKWVQDDQQTITTDNVGRVWTDKTVYDGDATFEVEDGVTATVEAGDADFLVALSALSSYSNLSTASSKPLDIVLVLDASGSMLEEIDTEYAYEAAYDDFGRTAYIKDGESYVKVERDGREWRRVDNGQRVMPKRSADDAAADRVQFYKRETVSSISKMEALEDAVAGFAGEVARQNDSIGDPDRRHRISVVKFASDKTDAIGNDRYRDDDYGDDYRPNYSQVVTEFAAYDSQNVSELSDTVAAIEPEGATRSDYVMEQANRVLGDARDNAQKVVIFFTDGQPTKSQDFDYDVADDAIAQAKAMKDAGALVWSVGVVDGADASDTSTKLNKYLHGVSSNYPNATAVNNLGVRGDSSKDYYYAADESEELKSVFEHIAEEVKEFSSGAPTLIEGDDPTAGGYIVFNDRLGDYMQVEDFKRVVFAGEEFFLKGAPVDDGNGTLVYTFTGTHEADLDDPDTPYPSIDMEDILISVTRSSDIGVGDVVTVKIPAANIPVSEFRVDEDADGGLSLDFDQAYPISVFYGVELKDGVERLLCEPDEAMAAYIAQHSDSETGTVSFYAGSFEEGSADGSTTATFVPSMGNAFNRYTADTPLYEDRACTKPVRADSFDPTTTTYYHERVVYTGKKGEAAEKVTTVVALRPPAEGGESVLTAEGGTYVAQDASGNLYIKASAPRVQRVSADIFEEKDENVTGTAANAKNPFWRQDENGRYDRIAIYLGNNGKLDVEQPGVLSVTKNATVADGSVGPVDDEGNSTVDDLSFAHTATIAEAAGKVFEASVTNAEGEVVSDADMTAAFDAQGTYTQHLKNGETLHIYGLPANAAYRVAETGAMPAGFAQKGSSGAEGVIVAGQAAHAVFDNEYRAADTEPATQVFSARKVFDAWDNVHDGASFEFRLYAVSWPGMDGGAEARFPEGSAVLEDEVGNSYVKHEVVKEDADRDEAFDFGGISFDRAGRYVYTIREHAPAGNDPDTGRIPGVDYSDRRYNVVVDVEDDGAGRLTVASVVMKDMGSAGTPEVADKVAVFRNGYTLASASVGLDGFKSYSDTSGGNPLAGGMFDFGIKPLTPGAPVPRYEDPETQEWQDAQALEGVAGAYRTSNYGDGTIDLGTLFFDEGHIEDGRPTVYVYELWELAGDEPGMTYDARHYYAHVTVEPGKTAEGVDCVVADVAYFADEAGTEPLDPDLGRVVFSNTYRAEPATAVVEGEKTLTGRDMLEGESFEFSLAADDAATQKALADGSIAFESADEGGAAHARVEGGKNGVPVEFDFGTLSFHKVGTYTFRASETGWNGQAIPQGGASGMRFDGHSCKVVVTVTLDTTTGKLAAALAYSHGGDRVVFGNEYKATGTTSGFTVAKTLVGKTMNPGDFVFAVEALGDAPAPLPGEREFANDETHPSGDSELFTGVLGNLTFTEADAGKVFEYKVYEKKPTDENGAAYADDDPNLDGYQHRGVTYDEGVYTVQFKPADNGDGTMDVDVVVLDEAGREVAGAARVDFTNAYAAVGTLDGSTDLAGTKRIAGDDMPSEDLSGFEFELTSTDADGNPVADETFGGAVALPEQTVVESDANGGFSFGDIVFYKAGTYYFTAHEVEPAEQDRIPGMSYDDAVFTVRIDVVDRGDGTLEAVRAPGSQGFDFVNEYRISPSEPVDLEFSKNVVGSSAAEGQFGFVFAAADEATEDALANGAVTVDGYDAQTGSVRIDAPAIARGETKRLFVENFVFSKAGTYAFTLAEDVPAQVPAGWTYDEAVRTVVFEVSDADADGILEAQRSDAAALAFVNEYRASDTSADIVATKKLANAQLEGGEFPFAILDRKGGVAGEAVNDADGTVDFEPLAYTTRSLGEALDAGVATMTSVDGEDVYEFQYFVVERTDRLPSGITPEECFFGVKVLVTDDRKGGLSAEVLYPESASGGQGLVFTNVYGAAASAEFALKGVKVYDYDSGANAPDIAGRYTFTLTGEPAADGTPAPMPERSEAVNDAAGEVDFGTISFTMEDVFPDALSDGAAAAGDGDESSDAGAGEAAGAAVDEGEAAGAAGAGEPAESSLDAADGTAAASAARAAMRSKTFVYTVAEEGSVAGVANDADRTDRIEVTVTDNGDGTLSVEKTKLEEGLPEDADFAFTNSYATEPVWSSPTGAGQLSIAKVLNGRDMAAGEFGFELVDGNGTVVATGENGAATAGESAAVTFGAVEFTAPGTYAYTVREVRGALGGVEYSTAVADVAAVVTDEGDGTLAVAWQADGSDLTFVNEYEAAPARVDLSALKTLEGDRGLSAGEFRFELKDAGGNVIATATNDADGLVSFPSQTFDEAGTYRFTVSEALPNDDDADKEGVQHDGVTYDETVYTVVVDVADDGQGSLAATVAIEDAESADAASMVFANVYETPETPVEPDPDPDGLDEPAGPDADPDAPDGSEDPAAAVDAGKPDGAAAFARTADAAMMLAAGAGCAALLAAAAIVVCLRIRRAR